MTRDINRGIRILTLILALLNTITFYGNGNGSAAIAWLACSLALLSVLVEGR